MTSHVDLEGVRVLVIEDEPLISMLVEESLTDMGCHTVAVVSTLNDALTMTAEAQYDVVMLDVNLGGQQTFVVAEFLCEKQTPFVFSTGHGSVGIPAHLQHLPVLKKPFQEIELKEILLSVLAGTHS